MAAVRELPKRDHPMLTIGEPNECAVHTPERRPNRRLTANGAPSCGQPNPGVTSAHEIKAGVDLQDGPESLP